MEEKDKLLIEKHIGSDEELRKYVEEHLLLEKKLEEFNKNVHLTADEEVEEKKIKKMKLAGRDKIEMILKKYR
ncbi:MAG: DUF465 domain-containing protein [Deltaproteobacteria bacterium]|jgi:hypothetical protein|nr:DUF465 domain-containing protein [Deltaproteobacteria bacterium]